MPRSPKSSLKAEDWLRIAFQSLTLEGVSALKVETLAPKLGATKGSFYWHFKDMPAFKTQMLQLWQAEATAAIIFVVNAGAGTGKDRLLRLAEIVSSMNQTNDYGGVTSEPSIRDWARHDATAAIALRAVDSQRLKYVSSLFAQHGFEKIKAQACAELFYTGFLGLQALAASRKVDVGARLKHLLNILLSGTV
jgi:AcrR family transcriptional regulator